MVEAKVDAEKNGDISDSKEAEIKLFKDVKYYVIGSLDESVSET